MTDEETDCAPTEPAAEGELVREIPILNMRGLHARASAKFVACVDRFDAGITVSRCGETVDGTSIMGLMMLAATCGTQLKLCTSGVDAEAALMVLSDLVKRRFDEDE